MQFVRHGQASQKLKQQIMSTAPSSPKLQIICHSLLVQSHSQEWLVHDNSQGM